jgi:hypothetical protein
VQLTVQLTVAQGLALRLRSLLLDASSTGPATVAGVAAWMGALQAQDLDSVLWSLGARLPLTRTDIEAALEGRDVLRTWPLRGTIHLVPSRDARWMVQLTGARALSRAARRRSSLGLSEQVAHRAVDVLAAALAGGGRLTRSQCLAALETAGIGVEGQRGYHLLWYACQTGVTCIAANVGGEQSFALLADWAPDPHLPDRDEALGILALRYFRGHGPTTVQDFAGWAGLPMGDARLGVTAAGEALTAVQVDGADMMLAPAALSGPVLEPDPDRVLVLPGFDEYLLGYKDRAWMLDPEQERAIIPGRNGVFQPTVVSGGRVVGTWRRSRTSQRTRVTVQPLVPLDDAQRERVVDAFGQYAHYLVEPVEVRWP